MTKVKLLVNTAYQGPRKEGDVINVPDDFAHRWIKNKIAEPVVEDEVDVEPEVEEIPEAEVSYEDMNAKQLYALCKEKGLDVEAKKSKEYYIEKLSQ